MAARGRSRYRYRRMGVGHGEVKSERNNPRKSGWATLISIYPRGGRVAVNRGPLDSAEDTRTWKHGDTTRVVGAAAGAPRSKSNRPGRPGVVSPARPPRQSASASRAVRSTRLFMCAAPSSPSLSVQSAGLCTGIIQRTVHANNEVLAIASEAPNPGTAVSDRTIDGLVPISSDPPH